MLVDVVCFFSSRRRHTRYWRDWSSDVCSSDLLKGLKKFTPQLYESAVENCARFFEAMGTEVERIVASLGFEHAQDLVGRSDLLVQPRAGEEVDLDDLIRPLGQMLDLEPLDLPQAPARTFAADPDRVLG